MRKLLLTASIALLGLTAAARAADQITIGNSTSGQATFTGLGNGNLSTGITAITGVAVDSLGGAGTYTLSAFGPVTVTSAGAGTGVWNFAAGVTDTFTYTSGADTVTETFTYDTLNDDSANPHYAGSDVVDSISGSAAFLAAFGGVGRGSTFDYAVDSLPTGVTLDGIASGTTSISSGISSGQVNPNAIPEPSTLAVFGAGIIGMIAMRHRRRSGLSV